MTCYNLASTVRNNLFDVDPGATLTPPPISTLSIKKQIDEVPAFVVNLTHVLTWKRSDINGLVKELRINKILTGWMNDNPGFRNWVMTILSCHIALNPLDAIEYPVPDQYQDEYGIGWVTVESFSKEALSGGVKDGRRVQPELKECTIHVMI
jgi:hypothetical protein